MYVYMEDWGTQVFPKRTKTDVAPRGRNFLNPSNNTALLSTSALEAKRKTPVRI